MESYYSYDKSYEKSERLNIRYNYVHDSVQPEEPALKLSDEQKAKLRMIKYLLEKLTGKKIRLLALELCENEDPKIHKTDNSHSQQNFSLVYESHQRYSESEKMVFSASGTVRTKDGRTIEFSLSIRMERSVYFEKNFQLRFDDGLKDPLLLNFDSKPVNFSAKKIRMDLDLDGVVDEFRIPASNLGFLALDLNDNGKIDSGIELFGPATGNGFKELSRYDIDKNRWIDQEDPIFAKLRVWFTDKDGKEKLLSLKDMNIGAIYLGFVPTKFSLYDGQGFLGQIVSSGIYLNEDGQLGMIHQIDLKV